MAGERVRASVTEFFRAGLQRVHDECAAAKRFLAFIVLLLFYLNGNFPVCGAYIYRINIYSIDLLLKSIEGHSNLLMYHVKGL